MPEEPVRFRDLTSEERAQVCDGCGAKANGKLIPDWCFTASCDHHDFNYWRGCTESDRKDADQGLYEAMRFDAARLAWWKRPLAYFSAWLYYRAVRDYGASYFHYAAHRRGRESLNVEMGQHPNWRPEP